MNLLSRFWNFSSSKQGLHFWLHFFMAGWITAVLNWGVVFVVAFGIEFYDWIVKREREYDQMADHLLDVFSWLLGAVVWQWGITPAMDWLGSNLPEFLR